MEGTITAILAVCTFLLVLLGWAYMLGITNAKVSRNESDIRDIKNHINGKLENLSGKMDTGFGEVYKKIDALPCKNPRWNSENCNV